MVRCTLAGRSGTGGCNNSLINDSSKFALFSVEDELDDEGVELVDVPREDDERSSFANRRAEAAVFSNDSAVCCCSDLGTVKDED